VSSARLYVGVDIGGTFTDTTVVTDDGHTHVGKVPSTRGNLAAGFFASIEAAAQSMGTTLGDLLARTDRLAHGTTTGINALVTREGARVGLLATKGHGDAIRIMDNSGRVTGVAIEEVLDYTRSSQPRQFLAAGDIVEVTERVDSRGEVVVALDRDALRAQVERLVESGVEALAVSYLWSFANPVHELATEEVLDELGVSAFRSFSHRIDPRLGEYERTATTVLNAYIGPLMDAYIEAIVTGARERGLPGEVLFAHSDGGLVTADVARRQPIITMQSGPVGGVIAAAAVGSAIGQPNVIATDMGGTTLDVSVIHDGRPTVSDNASVEQHALHLRKVDVESIGAGGGSIAWRDPETGTLRVGPASAGADPGPACYGRGGTAPTVTDADVVLGILNPNGVLGGDIRIDAGAAFRVVGELAAELGLDTLACAAGIVEIVDANMEDLVRRVTLQRGYDPRDFSLWAYGGQAGAHATLYAGGLGVRTVVVPMSNLASVWSSFGIGTSDVVRTLESAFYLLSPFSGAEIEKLSAAFERLDRAVVEECVAMGADAGQVTLRRSAKLKYALQVFEVDTPVPAGALGEDELAKVVRDFDRAYEQRFGENSRYEEAGFALTEIRVRGSVDWSKPPLREHEHTADEPQLKESRDVYWQEHGERLATPVYDGDSMLPGHAIAGPAILEFPHTTVAVRPRQEMRVDELGNVLIELEVA
jgi:N-methylhydantoinase A